MARFVMLFLLMSVSLQLSSCNNDDTSASVLEGVWRLQGNSNLSKVTFSGNQFIMESGTVTITGTFTLTENVISCSVTRREGAGSNFSQPDDFTGNYELDQNGNILYFTNFSGNWRAPFSSWYFKE